MGLAIPEVLAALNGDEGVTRELVVEVLRKVSNGKGIAVNEDQNVTGAFGSGTGNLGQTIELRPRIDDRLLQGDIELSRVVARNVVEKRVELIWNLKVTTQVSQLNIDPLIAQPMSCEHMEHSASFLLKP